MQRSSDILFHSDGLEARLRLSGVDGLLPGEQISRLQRALRDFADAIGWPYQRDQLVIEIAKTLEENRK